MKVQQITIIVEPQRQLPSPEPEHVLSYRQSRACDRLARELSELTQSNITIVQDFLCMAPPTTGFILLFSYDVERSVNECSPTLQKALLKRTIVMDDYRDRYDILSWIRRYQVAGVVDDNIYFGGWIDGAPVRYPGLFGPVAVAKAMNATIFTKRGHYCSMVVVPLLPLPQLLIRFMEAYLGVFPVSQVR